MKNTTCGKYVTVRDLIKQLQNISDQDAIVAVVSDPEGNETRPLQEIDLCHMIPTPYGLEPVFNKPKADHWKCLCLFPGYVRREDAAKNYEQRLLAGE